MDSWLSGELAGSVFKDKRLSERFKKVVESLSKGAGKTTPEVCDEWAMTKATYRFPANDRAEESEILAGHFGQTGERIDSCEGPVLILHDTTEFSYKRSNPENIGLTRKSYIPSAFKSGLPQEYRVCGVLVHTSYAVTPEGLPLGMISTRFWTRDVFKNTTQMKRHINPTRVPIEKKESIKWLQSLEATCITVPASPSKMIGSRTQIDKSLAKSIWKVI